MLTQLKKYWVWLLVLGIPLWNIFDSIFQSASIREDENMSTGAVILIYAGLYFGSNHARATNKALVEIKPAVFKGIGIAMVSLLFVILGQIEFVSHSSFALAISILIILEVFVLCILISYSFTTYSIVTKNKILISESKALVSESELKLLQSQLSPHFLFNTLNNLYSLSLKKDDKLPGLILKLSELLRHSVYQSGDTFVSLNEEIAYIRNYIEFERIRLDGRLELNVYLEENPHLKIAPLLLVVFIENAFKHSKNSSSERISIDIHLKTWENQILFSCANTYEKEQAERNQMNKNSGLGLENARRRLELLYPQRYDLKVEDDGITYHLMLQLK